MLEHHHIFLDIIKVKFKKIITFSAILLVFLIFGLNYSNTLNDFLYFAISRFQQYYLGARSWTVGFSYLYDHITGFAMVIGFIVALVLFLRKKVRGICVIYLVSFILLIFQITDPKIVGTIFFRSLIPERFNMIPWLTSWIIVAIGFHRAMNIKVKDFILERTWLYTRLGKFSTKLHIRSIFYLFFALLLLVQFIPSIIYLQNRTPNWYTASDSWKHDYEGLLWIHNNISPRDLILNDYSWAGLWILSFSYKNTTSNFYSSIVHLNDTIELNKVWGGELSPSKTYELLIKYNVSYIFTTSEWGYYSWPLRYNEGGRYLSKPTAPSAIKQQFDSLPFLECKFQSGNTAIYKVNRDFDREIGLLLDLKFDEDKGTVYDSSIYHNNASNHGVTIIKCGNCSALYFDGKNSYIIVENSPVLKLRDEFTIEFLVWLDDKDRDLNGGIAKGKLFGAPSEYDYQVVFHHGKLTFSISDGKNHYAISTTNITSKKWTHIAAIRDKSILRIYIDGELKAEGNVTMPTKTSSSPLLIGARIHMNKPIYVLHGMISKVRIYDYSLNSTQISKVYEESKLCGCV
jgi:hypothetical protein